MRSQPNPTRTLKLAAAGFITMRRKAPSAAGKKIAVESHPTGTKTGFG
jgi:hypothetical protein